MRSIVFQYEFRSELSPSDVDVVERGLDMHISGVGEPWKDTVGRRSLNEKSELYLERGSGEGMWWFTLHGPSKGSLPPELVAEVKKKVEAVLTQISSSWGKSVGDRRVD